MVKSILILSDGTEIMAGANEINAIQSVSIEESCNDGEDLNIGSVCAKKISVSIITPKNQLPIMAGERITLYEEENGVRRKKGVYNTEKPQKKNSNVTRIEAYDNISLLDKDVTEWFNALDNFPYTAFDMAQIVCEHCGIELSNSSIMNGDFHINKTNFESVTGRQIIRWIGEICGCFCVADEDGDILYRWYEEKNVPIVSNRTENGVVFLQGSLSYEDYETKKIDRVQIREEKNSVGIVYPNGSYGENSYIIESNPFLTEDARTADIAESLYNILRNISYVPCRVSVPYSFNFNVGDIVKIKDANNVVFYSYIMRKNKTGQTETLECTGGYERNGATTLYSTSYTSGYGEKLKIHKDIAKIELETNENGSKIGLIVETSDEGENSVKASVLLQAINEDESNIKIHADKINLSGYVTIQNLDNRGYQNENGVVTIVDGMINADYINTSILSTHSIVVKNNNENVLLSAGNGAVSIGGWTADCDTLKSDSFGKGIYLSSKAGFEINSNSPIYSMVGATSSIKDIVFRVGKASDAVFAIDAYGKMYATSGMIAGWTINTNSLTYSSYGAANHFGVYPKGVDFGNYPQPANAPSGTTWNLISGTNFGITQSGEIHSIAGKIGGISINPNGLYSGDRTNFQGVGSSNSPILKSGVFITASPIVLDGNTYKGAISLGEYSSTYNTWYDQYFYAGRHIISGYTGSGGQYKGIHQRASGIAFFRNTSEIAPYDDNTGKVADMTIGTDRVTLSGTWEISQSFITSSDRNVKNTISAISDKYSVLFDNLQPVTYKYNYGTSGRLHTGFIAQSVSEAMDKANVSSDEFAALCIENRGTEEENWGLRYEEFVALNTYEIQKLKKRILTLEKAIGI